MNPSLQQRLPWIIVLVVILGLVFFWWKGVNNPQYKGAPQEMASTTQESPASTTTLPVVKKPIPLPVKAAVKNPVENQFAFSTSATSSSGTSTPEFPTLVIHLPPNIEGTLTLTLDATTTVYFVTDSCDCQAQMQQIFANLSVALEQLSKVLVLLSAEIPKMGLK